jgi:replicative superfamily II helicase
MNQKVEVYLIISWLIKPTLNKRRYSNPFIISKLVKTTIMAKFLIEIPHSSDKLECLRSASILLSSGSHFLTNAEWGCYDGVHKAWFFMEAENKDEVLRIVPPAYRKNTIISQLNKFRLEEIERLLKHHLDTLKNP